MKVRIGIDVGGTFTDAVAIDNDTFQLIGYVKTPTTHRAKEGVAAGIIEVLHKIMEEYHISPDDVSFIAHGTTQATNALLEGDVAKVGIITLGSGLQGSKAKADTTIGNIELAPGKFLETENVYIDCSAGHLEENIQAAIAELKGRDCRSFVAAEAFSVDDPSNENLVVKLCTQQGLPATATNDISKLYGLKIRTRTAVINASIMPKMLETASMTDQSIKAAGIKAPLMIMRCDGGVMTVDEVRSRPILTILSGPAAGVAGALMYEKLTDGIFFEVGGTSTDISCVKDGKVMIRYAEVGGFKTYLNSLDVHTVGIGGGSMIELKDGKAVDTGPRSAHIAALDYEVYAKTEDIVDPRLLSIRPMEGDPDYAMIECAGGKKFALTLSGAANIAGYVKPEDYAYGNREAAIRAWKPLADNMGMSVEEAAKAVLGYAAAKNSKVAAELMKTYEMDPRTTIFVGGGGGAATVVPHLAETMGHRHRIARNAPVISTIGVALAMVRDMVERSVTNPTQDDIISVRKEAEQAAIQNGAAPGTIEIQVEVDTQRNIVRAIATGATEMRSHDRLKKELTDEELIQETANNLAMDPKQLKIEARTNGMAAVTGEKVEKKLFFRKTTHPLRLIDREGVIRLQKSNALVRQSSLTSWKKDVNWLLEELTEYNDGGSSLPNLYLIVGRRIVDLSGMQKPEQVISLAQVELEGLPDDEPVIVIGTKRVE
ncbi:MAG: hydantoinase/oxoprolinase family protein [Lachnospiraceae bacterium]|uniref:hydantoinase/oxoprolinase family protein n=1 Tax=Galactobacillus timonensis TaxID=2041840 RepID=UPI0023F1B0EB|nr:hydantoinase/oxoprolinase family protein [Galactobacillus timonensis]MCI6753378.1 hydantoinase/oxoprolinase family protein [Galactobacillus timonensis]MDD7086664.1 hydantoinase/oxoprolinase family protein [Galactobacillus timonensis]MDY5222143.1 hydantoinase/oxoprolinase family protein [Lachnospiraceae bacterium]